MFLNCTHCCFEHGWTLPEVLYIFANDYKLKLMHSCLLARMWYVCQKNLFLFMLVFSSSIVVSSLSVWPLLCLLHSTDMTPFINDKGDLI